MRRKLILLVIVLALLAGSVSLAAARGAGYSLERSVIHSVAPTVLGNAAYQAEAVVGQPVVGSMSNAAYSAAGGYLLPAAPTEKRIYLPLVQR